MTRALLVLAVAIGCSDPEPPAGPPVFPDAGAPPDASPPACAAGGETLGAPCTTARDCDDACFCNGAEQCVDGACAAGLAPCEDAVECTTDSCDEPEQSCRYTTDDIACSDGEACNGAERCIVGLGCRPGPALDCNDADSCTFDACDSSAGCLHEPVDLDHDGHATPLCGGLDCDDSSALVTPGAGEVCGNEIDDDCDGATDARDAVCASTPCDGAGVLEVDESGDYEVLVQEFAPGTRFRFGCGTTFHSAAAVVHLTLDAASDVSIEAGDPRPELIAIRPWSGCSVGPELACYWDFETVGGEPVTYTRRNLAAGEYAIVLPRFSGVADLIDLRIDITAPTDNNDVCDETAKTIVPGATERGTFDDLAGGEGATACTRFFPFDVAHRIRDAAYRFTIAERSLVRARASRILPWMTGPAWVGITSECGAIDATRSCARSGESPWRALEPGTYYLVVAAQPASEDEYRYEWEPVGDYEVTLAVEPWAAPIEGDSCDDPLPIPAVEAQPVYGDYRYDALVPCARPSDATDVVYEVRFTDESDVDVRLTGPAMTYSLTRGCGSADAIYCGSSPRTFRDLAPGTYYVAASIPISGSPGIVVTRTTAAPRLPNDTCAGAIAVNDGDHLTVDGSRARDEHELCGAGGGELVYRFTTDVASRLVATTSGPATLAVARECEPAVESIACETTGRLVQTVAPGTHYLFVETGAFVELDVFLTPAGGP
jgi:hypothetical protein